MRKKILRETVVLVGTAVVLTGVYLASGKGFKELAYLALSALLIAGISRTIDQLAEKALFEPKLLNWQLAVGSLGYLLSEFALGMSLNAESVFVGVLTLGIGVALFAASTLWAIFVYHPSVLGTAEHDRYVRHKFAKRIKRAVAKGDANRVAKLLALVCRYYCVDHDYRKGSLFDRPFDAKAMRNLVELRRGKEPSDQNTAHLVAQELNLLATNLVTSGYDFEDIKKPEEPKKEEKKEVENA